MRSRMPHDWLESMLTIPIILITPAEFCWHRNIPFEKIELGFTALLDRLVIPPEWYDLIIAYFLNDDGLLEYKRQTFELQQELERVRSLHTDQLLGRAQAIQKISTINAQLRRLHPSAHPSAATLIPQFQDFSKLWRQAGTHRTTRPFDGYVHRGVF